MKCPKQGCGWSIEADGKFCIKCGSQLIPSSTGVVAICDGTLENGSSCNTEITANQKYCKNCGKSVNQHLFKRQEETCTGCGSVLEPDYTFCVECGLKKEKNEITGSNVIEVGSCTANETGENFKIIHEENKRETGAKLSSNNEMTKDQQQKEIESADSEEDILDDTRKGQYDSVEEVDFLDKDASFNKNIQETKTNRSVEKNAKNDHNRQGVHDPIKVSQNENGCSEMDIDKNKGLGKSTSNEGADFGGLGKPEETEYTSTDSAPIHYPPSPVSSNFILDINENPNVNGSNENLNSRDITNSANNTSPEKSEVSETEGNIKPSTYDNSNTDENNQEEASGGLTTEQMMSTRQKKNLKSKEKKAKEKTDAEKLIKNIQNDNSQSKRNSTTHNENKPDTSADAKHSSRNNDNTSTSNTILVRFHILLSPAFNLEKEDKVILQIGAYEDGGWEYKDRVLRLKKTKPDGYLEMQIEVNMDINHLSKAIPYKYCLKRRENVICEHYPIKNRRLYVTQETMRKREIWDQFDGIVIPPSSEGFVVRNVKKLIGKQDTNRVSDAEIFATVFSPEWFRPETGDTQSMGTIQESIELLECLMNGLRKVYYVDGRCWSDEDEFKSIIGGCILSPVIEHIDRLPPDSSGGNLKMVRAMSIVFACTIIKITLSEIDAVTICRCLLPNPDNEKKTCGELVVLTQFFTKKEDLLKALGEFMTMVAKVGKNPSWLFCMPLNHFLSETCEPFASPNKDPSHGAEVPLWWGTTNEVDKTVKQFKRLTEKWAIPLDDVLNSLQPLFEMDFYMPRTIMATLNLHEVKEMIVKKVIPVEVCCATMLHYAKKASYRDDELKIVESCMAALREQLEEYFVPEIITQGMLNRFWMAYKIAAELFQEFLKTIKTRSEIVFNAGKVFLYNVSIYDRIYQQLNSGENSQQTEHLKICSTMTKECLIWQRTHYCSWTYHMKHNLQCWNNVFAEDLQSERIRDMWNDMIATELSTRFEHDVCKYTPWMQEFVKLYCGEIEKYKRPMQECLNRAAFKGIENGYNVDFERFGTSGKKKFGYLLSKMYAIEWDKITKHGSSTADKEILKMALTWSPFEYFVTTFDTSTATDILEDECRKNLKTAVSIIEKYAKSLHNGTIQIRTLGLIQKRLEKFANLVYCLKRGAKELTREVVQLRYREIDEFKLQAEKMTTFSNMCSHLPSVDMTCVTSVLNKVEKIEQYQVKDFCQPCPVIELGIVQKPKITAFKVPASVLDVLPVLNIYTKSKVFLQMWNGHCETNRRQCSTLEDVMEKIWNPVRQSWYQFSKTVDSGAVLFQEMEHLIGRLYRDNYHNISIELKILHVKDSTIYERINQLKMYRQLKACTKGARVILNVVKQYELKGNFNPIKAIAVYQNKNLQMKAFDDSLMRTCAFLKEITDDRANCLDAFVKCGPLVTWLQKSMEKYMNVLEYWLTFRISGKSAGLKMLKVFVYLAFMSAGDEPINIARVQCLNSAVTGYAPLIFDLKKSSDYKKLMGTCSIVWKELQANPGLSEKLIDTNLQLQWLQEIREAHRSVEVYSLVQAAAINSDGIFFVGRNANATTDENLELSNVLRLTVPENQSEKRQLRNYTFSQLQDLQSSLMLVAGKAENDNVGVERFTMIFDSVIRLSNMYLKLCSAGCVLFKDWTAEFRCDPSRPVRVILQFGNGKDASTLEGRSSEMEELQTFIPRLAQFAEECLDKWLDNISDKRRSYLHLNYFTIDQLVILQRELVKLGTRKEQSHRIYPLLSAVKYDCTSKNLSDAMSAAIGDFKRAVDMKTPGDKEAATTGKRFIHMSEAVGHDRNIATKTLEHFYPKDIKKVNYRVFGQRTSRHDVEPVFTRWSQSKMPIQSVITRNFSDFTGSERDVGVEPLLGNLTTLWKEFLGSITSNIQGYLSLEHLGMILKYLANQNTSHVNRNLPPGLKEGNPNLIVCASGEVLSTALSLYMPEKDQPLPQSDEVLMCTTHTTIDEVDIFWRRAIFDCGKKIHCLVNADLLDFEVSETAKRCLEKYMQETNYQGFTYRLVVVCGSDNEYRSRIVAFLDKYRRSSLPVKTHHLRGYLATKLRINKQIVGVKHAGNVDFNRSSVRLIKSWRSGMGKTLYKNRREADLARLNHVRTRPDNVSIPLQEKHIDLHSVISRLLEHTEHPGQSVPRIFHLDVAHEVQFGVDYLLFNLLVLGCLTDKTGYVWRKSPSDLYLIETMPLMTQKTNKRNEDLQYVHQMLSLLPDMTCRSPQESLNIYTGRGPPDYKETDQLFDKWQFRDPIFQRPFQYLSRLDGSHNLGSPQLCLQCLLRHCGMQDPSWAELHYFVWFLNTQLCDFEQNSFLSVSAEEDLPGFSKFVMRFLIQMSMDFSSRSLNMSEDSPGVNYEPTGWRGVDRELEIYQMRRTWERSPHPYLFFNSDKFTFTFLGFNIDCETGNLIDQPTGRVLETGIMALNLYDSLVRNQAPIQENFDSLPRHEKIRKLCMVMGIGTIHDPDDTYELTTDNVKKILAVYMRFRCDIPVIIMGETGCGKTRLIKFMCALQAPLCGNVKNMILMKVHGGTTNADIIRKVREAKKIARKNMKQYGQNMFTVLFFDEANSTESIGLIKEIMCDKSMEGKKLTLSENLKMVAACNPYRKHSDELIKKLERACLGYHVDADETTDKLGRVPMRRLVYRVQPLPQSMLPLVWDFGQLNYQVEELYIRQMIRRYASFFQIRDKKLPSANGLVEVVSAILTASQNYMREQKDECSFVSLRNVDRVLSVMSWFYSQSQGDRTLYNEMDKKSEPGNGDVMFLEEIRHHVNDDITRSLVLALGVCYHACLKTRPQYRRHIARFFRNPFRLRGGADRIEREIICCQDVFLDNVQLEKNIARNMALKENLFMMVVCIELRIPLFLVGKTGSSKSLAKTIVSDAMQGYAVRGQLFKEFKQAQMVSFQCSPLSTPEGIMNTFRQCAQFQEDKDLNRFVSIVVLDGVGLAEDSPRMPLKTLHPLLEDGCQGDENPEKYMKVAFIGISNWALDPAKMNRGILVQREVPDQEELQNIAKGICYSKEDQLRSHMEPLIKPMAESYLETFEKASSNMREFFGLRDFYSLVKMIYSFVEKSRGSPTWHQMLHAIKRNFDGLDKVDPVDSFRKFMATEIPVEENPRHEDPDCTAAGLIQACLFDTKNTQSESRYLLLLTENYVALTILQQQILDIRPITIFGSSFRNDQEYSQVCRNINKIMVCMDTGKTVILLNLENLYESLYNVLNQFYVYFAGERYVDLGLGTHRVKCPVHKDFRLIVVAEKQTVYNKFPIPLINRLEKHFLTINTMLSQEQQEVVKTLEDWAKQFSEIKQNDHIYRRNRKPSYKVGDVFMGYHSDTCSAIVLHVWGNIRKDKVLHKAKVTLLWCATPDAVVRLEKSNLPHTEQQELLKIYNRDQKHDSIVKYLQYKINQERCKQLFAQVTTHSKLLTSLHKTEISKATGINQANIMLLDTLSSFDTEQQFSKRIKQHMQRTNKSQSLLIVQCDSGDINANLIACARYCVMDEYHNVYEKLRSPVHIVFIVQLPRIAGGCFTGFQCGKWHSVHIDDLLSNDIITSILDMNNTSVAKLIGYSVGTQEDPMLSINTNEYVKMDWQPSEPQQVPGAVEDLMPPTSAAGIAERGDGIGYHVLKLNVKNLILSCVQAALSLVKGKDDNSARTTDRVPLVLKLFHNKTNIGSQFLKGVSQLIACLLEEKEANTQSYESSYWLVEEAAKFENIHKAGTFRRSCMRTLESKISPILAGIIAYLDRNQNLNILQDNKLTWKQDLWLDILMTQSALNLKYSELQSPARQSELGEAIVMTTGFEGHVFQGHLPFSWLMYEQITDILKAQEFFKLEHDEDEELCQTIVRLLSETAVGQVFQRRQDVVIVQKVVQDYIDDFVHVVYHAHSDHEHALVIQSISYVTQNMVVKLEETSLLHMLVCVHMSYQSLAPRLAYFRTMNQVWPDCSLKIVELKQTMPDHFMFKESEFTFSAVCLLIENLTPVADQFNNPMGKSRWLNKVHQYRPVVEKVLCMHAKEPNMYGAHGHQSVRRARSLWSRVVVMKLFLEHVCAAGNKDKITFKHCMPLWKLLGEEANLKELTSMFAIEAFLKRYYKTAMEEYMGKNTENLKEYQKCCNAFLMDVVSQLCFADNGPPSDEVIDKLLGYITCTTRSGKGRQVTKELSIFDSGIDPNPVFRSFILQLLMRTSEDKVKENLGKYLIQAQGLIPGGSNNKQHVELCQLIIQCLEDIFLQNTNKPDVDEVKYAKTCLQLASNVIFNRDSKTVETLYGLAESRVGLAITARYVRKIVLQQQQGKQMVDTQVKNLIEAAKNLCLKTDLEWPRNYLVKYMCRCYGIDAYQAACMNQAAFLRWIRMPNMNRDKVVEGSDRYVVCGDRYIIIRESLTKVILGEDSQNLAKLLQGMYTAGGHVEMLFQLAIHREITCSNLYPEQQRNVSAEVLNTLQNFIKKSVMVKNKHLPTALLRNQLGGNCVHLNVTEGADLRHMGLHCLLVHFMCVTSQLQGDKTMRQPLIMLASVPQACTNLFLPTMPQDDLAGVINALDERVAFYRCPNGHPYAIGDCRRPYVVSKCHECGAEIGGTLHELLPSNTADTELGGHVTLTGHILGRPEVRGQYLIAQRSLTPAYCAWLRLITHMSLYVGTISNIKGVQALIRPNLTPADVPEFLWQHMMMDLNDLQMYLGKSIDDIILLGHSINNKILNHRAAGAYDLTKEQNRHVWEQQFSTNYIQPIVMDMVGTLKTNNQLLLQDNRLGTDPLLCLVNEENTQEGREDPAMIQQVPAVWRYRTPISIEHLRQEFEAQSAGAQRGIKQHQVLKQFLQEEHYLRAIRYIPSILSLHRALFHKYQRKLDKAEASTITIGQIKKDEILGEETAIVIQDFVEAWELVREQLGFYLCPTEVGGMTVAREFCNTRIEDRTSISLLLPTTKEAGLCSFALLDFLMRKQNDFLDKYLNMSKRRTDSVSTIPAREVTSAHLISYDPQNDILPLVLANCQYSFEIGKGTKIEYDFTSLERQLMDRFLFSKSRIDVGRVLQIDLMMYRTEFTNAAVFKKLADKIPQESLSSVLKSQICSEIRLLPDLCLSLDNLDITISFLKSIGGNRHYSLNEFMINTLKMESSLQSQKARQVCQFQHTQSLWMVLSFQKSKKMAEYSQPRESIFESVIEDFHEDLPEETDEMFNSYLRNLSIDKLTQLLEVLHEYILLKVAVRENPDDEDYTDMKDNKLKDWLYVYIEGGDQFTQELLPILADFPEVILNKHSVHTWIIMYAMLREKQTGNRRR